MKLHEFNSVFCRVSCATAFVKEEWDALVARLFFETRLKTRTTAFEMKIDADEIDIT